MRFINASFRTRMNLYIWPSAGVRSLHLFYEKLKKFNWQNPISWNLNLTLTFSVETLFFFPYWVCIFFDVLSPSLRLLLNPRYLDRVRCFESRDNACSLFSFIPSCFMTTLTISPGGKKKAILLEQFPFLAFIAFKVQTWQCLKGGDKASSFSHAAECHDVVDNGILAWDGLEI